MGLIGPWRASRGPHRVYEWFGRASLGHHLFTPYPFHHPLTPYTLDRPLALYTVHPHSYTLHSDFAPSPYSVKLTPESFHYPLTPYTFLRNDPLAPFTLHQSPKTFLNAIPLSIIGLLPTSSVELDNNGMYYVVLRLSGLQC